MRFRSCLKPVCAALTALLLISVSAHAAAARPGQFFVYFGTFTGTNSKGIYVSRFDSATGKLSAPALAAQTVNPSFVAIAPDHHLLFAVNETDEFHGQASGAVSAFKLDASSGKLELLNQQPSGGTGPCHVTVDP
ncbi:MAG TPA: beta-propeller fold lactonase family protein, partial [Verrucomicrobiae bacterium]|nr:beta-propeller fold lactonase family protein [Verrucomicrobiae bacterium]